MFFKSSRRNWRKGTNYRWCLHFGWCAMSWTSRRKREKVKYWIKRNNDSEMRTMSCSFKSNWTLLEYHEKDNKAKVGENLHALTDIPEVVAKMCFRDSLVIQWAFERMKKILPQNYYSYTLKLRASWKIQVFLSNWFFVASNMIEK